MAISVDNVKNANMAYPIAICTVCKRFVYLVLIKSIIKWASLLENFSCRCTGQSMPNENSTYSKIIHPFAFGVDDVYHFLFTCPLT